MGHVNAPRVTRWTEIDRFGRLIVCTEDVWAFHLAKRPELALFEPQARDVARNPDAVYEDPEADALKTPIHGATVKSIIHVGMDRLVGQYVGRLLVVVIKWRQVPAKPAEWFLQTAYATNRIPNRWVAVWSQMP